ncbi:hypothetical protein HU200_067784 [Digitaria exilis]|uniref:Uncharacterized protein n=1 Tax=Digitaria exilis TaxID=1010633 RepID=A0A835A5G7_9POAL|nr:hypothetical protein HU200_067784 [Digitaria exilis]
MEVIKEEKAKAFEIFTSAKKIERLSYVSVN